MAALRARVRTAAGLWWIDLDPSEGSKPSEGFVHFKNHSLHQFHIV
jgi:hypothetical protein